MLIESKIKIGHDSMFNIRQANFKSARLLNKMALVQSQRNRTVYIFLFVLLDATLQIGRWHFISII